MEFASQKLLEAATHRTLHGAAFSRASTQASAVLTDLLARYMTLLAATSAKYAQHAGRTTVTCTDALEALDDLGVGMQDLVDYVPEAKELARYALYSARRVEELHEFKAHLGKNAREGAVLLEYAPYEGEDFLEDEDEDAEGEDEEMEMEMDVDGPPLKRQRTLDWDGHIPTFLPPFPSVTETNPESPRAESPAPLPPPLQPSSGPAPAPAVPALQLAATSTSAADYFLQIPYEQSSLADVSQWHLPGPRPPPPPATGTTATPSQAMSAAKNPELALYRAFHHILSHPTRAPAAATPARHRVAMALLTQTQLVPRWDVPDTMYAASAPAAPRAWPIVPTFAVPVSSKAGEPPAQRRFPPTQRTIASPAPLAPLVGSQGSRLPELARRVLPPPIYARVTRLTHPSVLARGPKLLTYGPGVPAPWNSPATANGVGAGADGEGAKERDAREARIPDARMYATWEYETKDFKSVMRRPRMQAPPPPSLAGARRSSRAVV
ncbi:hypothetical protein DFH07DRAFT_915704 [Mycena maculata]|uniref:Bromodomain associated domain-containing protein n=1 Tax=Mycena maculata TaxID=230809 RepID=A0AAD7NNB9_9AGAR|nr:hypothetical protein DFH07DRAFT_915704 [Mycena maculata]